MKHTHYLSVIRTKIVAITLVGMLFAATTEVAFGQVAPVAFDPYEETFTISAYYSPLPNQSVYFRGSYEADRRLNGNGTNGADGTQVFPGMLAAPQSYAFGTKLEIPGLGVGVIHDRGGAIVDSGERGNKFDRIDVWMGKGEEGLARALSWGMRTVKAKVYPPSYPIAASFTLPGAAATFTVDLTLGDTGSAVTALQKELKTYGYFKGETTGVFDENTREALKKYQFARRIVKSSTDLAAGVFSAATRDALNREVLRRTLPKPTVLLSASVLKTGSGAATATAATNTRFPVELSVGDRGDRVREMQAALFRLGYCRGELNAIFDDQLKGCIVSFQIAQGILKNSDEFGAGVFGTKTRAALATSMTSAEALLDALIKERLPSDTAKPGDAGALVKRIQQGLTELGYFTGVIDGTYDEETRLALVKFQVNEKIIDGADAYGAGHFGLKTKAVFAEKLRTHLVAGPVEPKNPTWNRPVLVAYTPTFTTTLDMGDTGAAVTELQKTLAKLGYFAGQPTGTFDDATRAAVVKFQMTTGIVKNETDTGAGTLGPKTRTALNATVAREKIALTKEKSLT